jgi:hypothetical protein
MTTIEPQKTDYKIYFLNEFTLLFIEMVNYCIANITNQKLLTQINKITELINELDYSLIANKYALNTELQTNLIYLKENNFSKDSLTLKSKDKCWNIIPYLNIYLILLNLNDEQQMVIYDLCYKLYSCSSMYVKAIKHDEFIEQTLNNKSEQNEFNPFEFIEPNTNLNIDEMFKNAEQKSYLPHEILIGMISNLDKTKKISEHLENINENEISNVTEKLNDVLQSEEFKNKNSTNILSSMINNVKDEILKIGQSKSTNGINDKESMDMLIGIAQKIAIEMKDTITNGETDIIDLWDTTTSLSKSTINNPMVDMMTNMIRSNIISSKEQFEKQEKLNKRNKKNKKLNITNSSSSNDVDELTTMINKLK